MAQASAPFLDSTIRAKPYGQTTRKKVEIRFSSIFRAGISAEITIQLNLLLAKAPRLETFTLLIPLFDSTREGKQNRFAHLLIPLCRKDQG